MYQLFKFDIGGETDSPLGMTASIRAETKEEALAELREWLENLARETGATFEAESEGGEYICIYTYPEAIDTGDIYQDDDEESKS